MKTVPGNTCNQLQTGASRSSRKSIPARLSIQILYPYFPVVQEVAHQMNPDQRLSKGVQETMLAAIKVEVRTPTMECLDEGSIAIEFHMPPICSPLVRPGRLAEAASVISKQLSDTILREDLGWLINGKSTMTFRCFVWLQYMMVYTTDRLRGCSQHFCECFDEMINRWEELVSKTGSCELDVAKEFLNVGGDVISRAAFGSNIEEGRSIFLLQKEQCELILASPFTLCFPSLS